MPQISLTDTAGNPVEGRKIAWTALTSLYDYLRSELLHLMVFPDYIARKDESLPTAAPKPLSFSLKVGNTFTLGTTAPEIEVTPNLTAVLRVNATADSSLYDDDLFRKPATVPAGTGYVGLTLGGALKLAVGASAGDLSFGVTDNTTIQFEFLKAFPLGGDHPKLGWATEEILGRFVIPAKVADFQRLFPGDIASVSGKGSLKLSASFQVLVTVNPLASVDLPLNVGTIKVQHGALAGIGAEFQLSGAYEIRVRALDGGKVELSYLRKTGTALSTTLSASAGIAAKLGGTDLLAKLLGVIGTDKLDSKQLDKLTDDERATFTDAVKDGIAHSLQGSLDLALATGTTDEAAFQYEITLAGLDEDSRALVERALTGDLRGLNSLEPGMQADGTLAPGVRLLNSILKHVRERGTTLHVNLLGIVNLISVSKLVDQCEFIADPPGHLTIKETAQSERISAIVVPLDRKEALRKALFESVVVTTAYSASLAISLPDLECNQVHFAQNQNTGKDTLLDYLGWFVCLNLVKRDEVGAILAGARSGIDSTCVLRTAMDAAACSALFLSGGKPRTRDEYEDIGRQALRALLDTKTSEVDGYRYRMVDDLWGAARETGASPALGSILPIDSSDPRYNVVLADVIGDIYDIEWWADSMSAAAIELHRMRTFLNGRTAESLAADEEFAKRRSDLQQAMLRVLRHSNARFHEPWGMVCLFWAAGSRKSEGTLDAGSIHLQRP